MVLYIYLHGMTRCDNTHIYDFMTFYVLLLDDKNGAT